MYRNEHDAQEHRVAQLRERVAERRARLTERLLLELPAALREQLDKAGVAIDNAGPPGVRLAALEHLDAVLDEIFALAPELELELNTVPHGVHPDMAAAARGRGLLHHTPALWEQAHARLPAYLADLDRSVVLAEPKPFVLDGTLRFGDVPVAVRLQPDVQGGQPTGELCLALATTVRASTPRLDVRPLTFGHTYTKWLRIHRDIEIGDDEIDHRFLIQGDAELARRFFDAATRRELLKMAAFDLPRLEICDDKRSATRSALPTRVARITWRWDTQAGPLRRAMKLLGRLRALDTTVRILAEE